MEWKRLCPYWQHQSLLPDLMENIDIIISEAQREIEVLIRYMPASFEIDSFQSIYEVLSKAQAEGAYQSIKPLNVYPVGEVFPDDLKLCKYGSIKTRWSPVDQLGTALEWIMQKDVSDAIRAECLRYLKGEIEQIDLNVFKSKWT